MENESIKFKLSSRILDIKKLSHESTVFPIDKLETITIQITKALLNGKKIAFVGNGGSAAEASHLAAEFTGHCVVDHKPLRAMCLNESISAITAIGNDYGFENIFSRLVEAELDSEDVLIAMSTSGKSTNIVNALLKASEMGVNAHLWMGNFEQEISGVEIWKVPSSHTPRIQEIHLMWGHIISEIVELNF